MRDRSVEYASIPNRFQQHNHQILGSDLKFCALEHMPTGTGGGVFVPGGTESLFVYLEAWKE
jgi:hypothetical protein